MKKFQGKQKTETTTVEADSPVISESNPSETKVKEKPQEFKEEAPAIETLDRAESDHSNNELNALKGQLENLELEKNSLVRFKWASKR